MMTIVAKINQLRGIDIRLENNNNDDSHSDYVRVNHSKIANTIT